MFELEIRGFTLKLCGPEAVRARSLLSVCILSHNLWRMIVTCLHCQSEFDKLLNQIKRFPRHFCSNSCSAKYNNPRKRKPNQPCRRCGQEVNTKAAVFCSSKCSSAFPTERFLSLWKAGKITGNMKTGVARAVRAYLFSKYRNACAQCGWSQVNQTTGLVPLEVEHIDGNWKNSSEGNLTLLCPNCHSLTPTYRALNKGRGRPFRYKK